MTMIMKMMTMINKKAVQSQKPRDAAAVLFGLKFDDKFKTSLAKLRKPSFRAPTIAAQNRIERKMAIQGHSRSRVLESGERR